MQKDIEKKYEGINQKKNEISKEHDIEVEDVQKKKSRSLNVRGSSFSGPIPPPNIIKGYEEILPGSAELSQWQKTNQSIDKKWKKLNFVRNREMVCWELYLHLYWGLVVLLLQQSLSYWFLKVQVRFLDHYWESQELDRL